METASSILSNISSSVSSRLGYSTTNLNTQEQSGYFSLPTDCIILIFDELKLQEIGRMGSTCNALNAQLNGDMLNDANKDLIHSVSSFISSFWSPEPNIDKTDQFWKIIARSQGINLVVNSKMNCRDQVKWQRSPIVKPEGEIDLANRTITVFKSDEIGLYFDNCVKNNAKISLDEINNTSKLEREKRNDFVKKFAEGYLPKNSYLCLRKNNSHYQSNIVEIHHYKDKSGQLVDGKNVGHEFKTMDRYEFNYSIERKSEILETLMRYSRKGL